MATQGGMANINGGVFERMMIPLFSSAGFEVFSAGDLNKRRVQEHIATLTRYIIRNATYTTIYGSDGRTEFLIVDGERRIRVEAKYQAAAGSVDEKYPYMYLNGVYAYPENEIIFVVDGGGYKPGARTWLQQRIDENWLDFRSAGKDIRLMSMVEFVNWFNHEFH